jgi:hypothetical protein
MTTLGGRLQEIVVGAVLKEMAKNRLAPVTSDSRCFGCKENGANCERTLKNGRTQFWHKECLASYRKDRDEMRDSAIAKSGGLEAAKQSMKLLGGPPAGTCTDCGEPVTKLHDRIRTDDGLVTHVGCL